MNSDLNVNVNNINECTSSATTRKMAEVTCLGWVFKKVWSLPLLRQLPGCLV